MSVCECKAVISIFHNGDVLVCSACLCCCVQAYHGLDLTYLLSTPHLAVAKQAQVFASSNDIHSLVIAFMSWLYLYSPLNSFMWLVV